MKILNMTLAAALLAPALSQADFGGAVPVKFAKCAAKTKINEVPNGNGVVFNETCDIAYVLPPQSGTLKMLDMKPAGDPAEVCKQYHNIESAITSATSSVKIATERLEYYNKTASELIAQLEEGLIPEGMTVDSVNEKIDGLLLKAEGYNDKFVDAWTKLADRRDYFTKETAATGKFAMENYYTKLVEAYQKKNPSITVRRMPVEQSYLMINDKSPNLDANAPGGPVVSLTTTGGVNLPFLKYLRTPTENMVEAPKIPGAIFTEGLTGNIELSAIGVCPLMKSAGIPSTIDIQDVETYISASVVYQYHVQTHRKHHITYNLAQLAKRIEETSQKGGFLSSKSVHSLTETSESKKWINFETYEEDPTFTYTEEYKKEIKQQFLNTVLQEVAYVSFDNPSAYPSLLPTGEHGANVAADALGKCPHLYCQVGMYALKFIDSTFGKTTAISNYIKTRDVWAEETVDETQMTPYYGSYPLK